MGTPYTCALRKHTEMPYPFKVVQVNTNDILGGAARAAYRLNAGLRRLGHDSIMLVLQRNVSEPSVVAFGPPVDFGSRLYRRLRRIRIALSFRRYRRSRPAGFELFSDDRTQFGAQVVRQLTAFNIVNLHWVSDFVDISKFFRSLSVPVVWTLHDMYAFTGGCHYDDECGKFVGSCGACPQLGSSKGNDLSRQVLKRKKKVFDRLSPERLRIVAPSRWMASAVERSSLLRRFSVAIIPYSLDTAVFAPRDPKELREELSRLVPYRCSVIRRQSWLPGHFFVSMVWVTTTTIDLTTVRHRVRASITCASTSTCSKINVFG